MKRLFLLLCGILVLTSTAFAFDTVIERITARPDGDTILLEWQSGNEAGVRGYAIERSDMKLSDYEEIGRVNATGNNAYYSYHDQNIVSMMANQRSTMTPMSDLYKYRLRLIYDNAISYSQTISVSRPSAGVKRTWGMIKEMFH